MFPDGRFSQLALFVKMDEESGGNIVLRGILKKDASARLHPGSFFHPF